MIKLNDNDKKHKIAFVILHYCAIEDTFACVDSIQRKIDTEHYEIVIVDNHSPDNSGADLLKRYASVDKIKVLINDENMGFAKGNNVGFSFAKKELGCDFIVLLNNDTLIVQDDFFAVILDEYHKSDFSVLGPKIITPKPPFDDNPGRDFILSEQHLDKYILKIKTHLFFNYLRVEGTLNKMLKLLKKKSKSASTKKAEKVELRCENVQLHGCCWIFSPTYVKLLDGIDSRTFLYKEEEILYTQMMRRGLKTVYNPALKVYHKEDASTNSINSRPYLKRRFIYKNLLESTVVLKKVLNEEQ